MLGKEFEFEGKKYIVVSDDFGTCKRCVFKDDSNCCEVNSYLSLNLNLNCDSDNLIFIEDTRKC